MWFYRFSCVELAQHPSSGVNSRRPSFDSPRELEFFPKWFSSFENKQTQHQYWLFSLRFFSSVEEKPVDKRNCAVFYVNIWLSMWVIFVPSFADNLSSFTDEHAVRSFPTKDHAISYCSGVVEITSVMISICPTIQICPKTNKTWPAIRGWRGIQMNLLVYISYFMFGWTSMPQKCKQTSIVKMNERFLKIFCFPIWLDVDKMLNLRRCFQLSKKTLIRHVRVKSLLQED